MNVLEFISSLVSTLVWPAVAVGFLYSFRKKIGHWLTERPNRIKAGPVEAEWDRTMAAAAETLQVPPSDQTDEAVRSEDSDDQEPLAFLGLKLRELARIAPLDALLKAWWAVEEELQGLALTAPQPGPNPRHAVNYGLEIIRRENLVPRKVVDAANSLRKLRNVAVHGVEPVSTTQALEFINLADLVVAEVRPIRQRRELENAMAGVDAESVARGRLYE